MSEMSECMGGRRAEKVRGDRQAGREGRRQWKRRKKQRWREWPDGRTDGTSVRAQRPRADALTQNSPPSLLAAYRFRCTGSISAKDAFRETE